MTYWGYYDATGASHGSGGVLEGVLVTLACVALELLVVAVAVWSASIQDSMARRRSERRRPRCPRRRVQRRLAGLAELDAWLDQVWEEDVDGRRRDAAQDAARLISSQTRLVSVRCCRGQPSGCCAQLIFADGTTLALWSRSLASEHKLHRLDRQTVLQWASPADRGDLKFGTEHNAILINGDLLSAGAR
jgi:hypothetical protein